MFTFLFLNFTELIILLDKTFTIIPKKVTFFQFFDFLQNKANQQNYRCVHSLSSILKISLLWISASTDNQEKNMNANSHFSAWPPHPRFGCRQICLGLAFPQTQEKNWGGKKEIPDRLLTHPLAHTHTHTFLVGPAGPFRSMPSGTVNATKAGSLEPAAYSTDEKQINNIFSCTSQCTGPGVGKEGFC